MSDYTLIEVVKQQTWTLTLHAAKHNISSRLKFFQILYLRFLYAKRTIAYIATKTIKTFTAP